jgi:UDP:flavonoid glycosyltransferase YjiC (YdhE family)
MPAATLVIAGGIALFFVVALAYAWPVLSEPVPVDADQDYVAERVRARLVGSGLIYPMLAGSFLVSGFLVSRWTRRP